MSVITLMRTWVVNSPRNLYFCLRSKEGFDQKGNISYGPYFIEPRVTKEKQDELFKSGEAEKLSHIPVKAALNHQTCSIFHDQLTRKFMSRVMKCGNKALARDLIEKTFANLKRIQLEMYNKAPETAKKNIELNPVKILHDAIANSQPLLELTPVKRGGVRYQVPVPITEKRSQFLGIKWLIDAGNDKERKMDFPQKLARELLDAAANQGRVVKKKIDLHRQCEANKAYAHYRWS